MTKISHTNDSNCRCCFKSINDYTFSLLDECLEYKMTIYELFVLFCGLRLSEKELNTGFICQNCIEKLLEWQKFRRKIIETAEKFKEIIMEEKFILEDDHEEEAMNVEWLDELDDSLDIKPKPEPACKGEPLVESSSNIFVENSAGYYECPNENCAGIFACVGRLKLHLKLKHQSPETEFKCKECSIVFDLYSDLKRHLHDKHTSKPFICDLCDGKRFASLQDLRGHMRAVHLKLKTVSKKTPCPICGKIFSGRDKMSRHRQIIHFKDQIRPFICSICGFSCISKDVLRKHLIVHSNERPFQCLECDKSFKLKGILTVHIKAVHVGERNFICGICGCGFKNKRQLNIHMVTHSIETPFKCEYCPASFKLKRNRKTHEIRMHCGTNQGEIKLTKPKKEMKNRFQCSLCCVTFYTRKQVAKHIQTTHEESIFGNIQEFVRRTIL